MRDICGWRLSLAFTPLSLRCLALTFATAPWQIYALTVPAATGAAALLSMPLTYFQDLFPGRPGLALLWQNMFWRSEPDSAVRTSFWG
jgi:hypothetical protein